MKKLKRKIINWCIKNLAFGVVDEQIISYDKLSSEDKLILFEEARSFKNGRLWKRLLSEMNNTARDLLFNKSKNEDDMMFGKATLYAVDLLDKKVSLLASKALKDKKEE